MTTLDFPGATSTQLFGPAGASGKPGMAEVAFGRIAANHRYKMPLLPGEQGTKGAAKSGGPSWVPGGMRRTTNLAGAFAETRALSRWEQEQAFIGLVRDPSLYEQLTMHVRRGDLDGVDMQALRDHLEFRKVLSGTPGDEDTCLIGQAKRAAGANIAREKGTLRHTVWEYRAETGELIGTDGINTQIVALETLLAANHLERVPGLSERTIRNTEVECAGRFDDILCDTRTGEMFIADLKTKAREFFTWLEIDIQLAVYARAAWMLSQGPSFGDRTFYVAGPLGMVNQERGVVLHMPSDGAPPRLRRADLVRGWSNALLAKRIVDERAWAKSSERLALTDWTG